MPQAQSNVRRGDAGRGTDGIPQFGSRRVVAVLDHLGGEFPICLTKRRAVPLVLQQQRRQDVNLDDAGGIYGEVTAITLYLACRLETRISMQGMLLADRLAGILLTAIAVILLANGFTDLVTSALRR